MALPIGLGSVLAITLVAAGAPVRVALAEADRSEQIAELFRLSGIEQQPGSLDQQIVDGISTQADDVPPEVLEGLMRVARREFSTKATKVAVLARLASQFHPVRAR